MQDLLYKRGSAYSLWNAGRTLWDAWPRCCLEPPASYHTSRLSGVASLFVRWARQRRSISEMNPAESTTLYTPASYRLRHGKFWGVLISSGPYNVVLPCLRYNGQSTKYVWMQWCLRTWVWGCLISPTGVSRLEGAYRILLSNFVFSSTDHLANGFNNWCHNPDNPQESFI